MAGGRWRSIARLSVIVAILASLVLSSMVALASAPAPSSPARTHLGAASTPETVTFTGNPSTDFPSDALLYTNGFTPWGSGNNFTGLYGTWNTTAPATLFIAVSNVLFSGNTFLFAVSNDTSWGTTNLSNLVGAGAGWADRLVDFTQPFNYLFYVNSSYVFSGYEVTSKAGAASTTVTAFTPAKYDDTITSSGGSLEIALPFATLFPAGFPKYANVSLYACIFGGPGPYVGPTIPSGQSWDVTYKGTPPYYLTSHDLPDGYLRENTFYRLSIDPQGLGAPDSGITPNYTENLAFHTVTFTGNLKTDFAPGEKALINTNTMYGGSNLLNSSYITWNETTLFLGFNASIASNNLYFFLSNDTTSGNGTFNLNYTNVANLNRPFYFSDPVNFIGRVVYDSAGVPSSLYAYNVTSRWATSNTSVILKNISTAVSAMTTPHAVEVAIPFAVLYGRHSVGVPYWPVIGQFANVSLIAAIVGGGGPSTGPTLPAGQGYAYTGYYNTNHTDGYYELLNTFFTENLDPYGDGVPAAQINPTYTYGHTYHSVTFTGTITNDFVAPEIVGTGTYTGWSSSNLVNTSYATWNYTDLFIGTNSTVGGGNWFMVAISNGTGVGATNFSSTNVANLTRNFLFGTPINFVFEISGGARNGSLYEVVLSGTTSTHTQFTAIASIPAGKNGDEFAIPFSVMYPTHPSAAGADAIPPGVVPQLVAAIYGGAGAYIGPTIPTGQNFSQAKAGQYASLNQFVSLNLDPNKNGYSEPGIVPSAPLVVYKGNPISLNIVFNDHQPLYAAIGGAYLLPWAVVHLEEYAEQALIAGMYPTINITYSLSGSLLYQIESVAHGDYNNSYLQAAWIPWSQWGNTVYTEVTQYGDTFLSTFVPPYEWNTTTVAYLLEYDLAFNTPLWVYSAPTKASALYSSLFALEQGDHTLTAAQLNESLVEFFLWSTSWPIVTGQLGSQYINSTMWAFYNDSSFPISDLKTIAAYYPVEAQLVLSAFSHDRMLNDGAGGNVELITTPFDHPILPLLLLGNWTDENGAGITKGIWASDTTAQLQIGSQLYQQIFGQAPLGLWSPEQAVSAATIPFINKTGYEWTSSSQATLAAAGIGTDLQPVTAAAMEALYTPYRVSNGTQSTVMVFRDDSLSNDWGFNYGSIASSQGNWAAVGQLISYLKNVYAAIPRIEHSSTVVTVALDGENWMFMSPFPEDAVPFLKDVYTALEQNSSWLNTTTMQQYLAKSPSLPSISSLPIGSWNNQPSGTGINPFLGQWAGHNLQDATWQQLALVRSEVQAFGTANGLTQPTTLATLEQYNYFPYLTKWNTSTLEGKYVEAWTAIYGVEGSDIYFAFDPVDQSPTAQNAIVFEQVVRADLSLALTILGLPLTPFLEGSYQVPLTPTTWGTNQSITPALNGLPYTTGSFPTGTAYSISHNNAWAGSYIESTGNTASGSGEIAQFNYAFDVSNFYFSFQVNGPTSAYKSPNFYTPATDAINVYFSPINLQPGNLQALGVPDAIYGVGTTPFGFAATTEVTIEGNSVTPTGSASLGVFASSASGTWTSVTSVAGDAFVGSLLQLQIPYSYLSGMVPGDSIEFFVAAVNGTTGAPVSWEGPMLVTVPSALAKLTLISSIHNTAPDNGPGYYTYPTGEQSGVPLSPFPFPPGAFDMKWVNVSTNPYTVQFNITFGNLSNVYSGDRGFSQPIIDIYIHEPGGGAGSTKGLAGTGIDIATQSAWQWAIQASGYAANNYLENGVTGLQYPAPVLVTTNLGEGTGANGLIKPDKTVSIEVPTSIIGTNIGAYSYVIIAGSQDGYGVNGWRIVYPTAQEYQGGGAPTAVYKAGFSGNVYSYLSPAMVGSNATLTQQDLLANQTSTHSATLVGIQLKLLHITKPISTVLGASAIVNLSGDPEGFFAIGSQVYSTSSTNGITWTTAAPLVNLSFIPAGMAAVGGSSPALFAWGGENYVVENLVTGTFENGTASGTIAAGAITYSAEGLLLALEVGGAVEVGPPGATVWTEFLGATAVGLSTSSGVTYLAYATAAAVNVVEVSLAYGAFTIGTVPLFSAAITNGATIESISLAVTPQGAFAMAVAEKNASGSNIYFASGTGSQTLKAITVDGLDTSPSVLLGESGGVYSAYVGFTNGASGGNVFFLPIAIGTVAPTVVPTPPAAATPWWLYVLIGLSVALAIIAMVALIWGGRGGRPSKTETEPMTEWTGPESTETKAPAEGGASPPSGTGPG
jgi:alpha-amylase/alpha-mannosidase (GH57 family)